MIELKNINIDYLNKTVFHEQSLKISNTGLTCITGESGSGKTTLLNNLALNQTYYEQYIIDGHNIANIDKNKLEEFKEENIYYVEQTPKFFNDIKLIDYLSMYDVNYIDLTEILKELDLHDKLNLYPNQLSGGEKIKFSLLLAFISNSPIILLDEPTASLDYSSIDIVIKMINKLSKISSYVICSTHSKELINQADNIININNGVITYNLQKDTNKTVRTKKNLKHINKILLKAKKHHPMEMILKYFAISLITAIAITSAFSNNYAAKHQEKIISNLGSTQLIIFKPLLESQKDYYSGNYEFPFSDEEIADIKKIKHIDKIDGYLVTISNGHNDIDGNPIRQTRYQINKNNQTIIDYTIDYEKGDGANTSNNLTYTSNYYPDKKYQKGGIYLSTELANKIGYKYQKDTTLKTTINVPTYNLYNASYLVDEKNNKIPACDYIGKLVEIELPIYGVIDNYPEWNNILYNNSIFISYEIYNKLIEDNNVFNEFERNNYNNIELFKPFEYNSYYIQIDSIANFEYVTNELNKLGINYFSQYADAKQAKSIINEQKDTMTMLSIILFISLLIITIIISNTKKKDDANMINYFKAIGLSKHKINNIRITNYLIDGFINLILTGILIIITINVFKILKITYITFEPTMLILTIIITIVSSIIIPYIVSIKYYVKNK